MIRSGSILAAVLVAGMGWLLTPSAAAQSNEELQKQIEELTRRVEALESNAPAARPTPTRPAASTQQGQQEARALYDTIDDLLATGDIDGANRALTDFNTKYAGTGAARYTASLVREMAVVGKSAPEDWFIEKWYQGETDVKLNGKKPTLVIFWESWCPHCRSEVPKFQRIHDENKTKGLQVVGVTRLTRSATEESVKSFIAENGVSYPMAKETGDLATYFNVKGIPAAAIVKGGKIVWRGHPQRLDDEMLAAWF